MKNYNNDHPKGAIECVFIVDTSYSMYGDKIDAINNLINNSINFSRSTKQSKKHMKISILDFNSSARWVYREDIQINKTNTISLVSNGKSNINEAYTLLLDYVKVNLKDRKAIFILISDGLFSNLSWKELIKLLYKNENFTFSYKYAISLGNNLDESYQLFLEFTQNQNTIFQVYSEEALHEVVNIIFNSALNYDLYEQEYIYKDKNESLLKMKEQLKCIFNVSWR